MAHCHYCRKVAHKSHGKALAAMRALQRVIEREGKTDTVNVYPCPRAPWWHVGHVIARDEKGRIRHEPGRYHRR